MMDGRLPASTSSASNACMRIKMHTPMCSLTWRLDICCFPKPCGVWTRYGSEVVGHANFVHPLCDNSSHASASDSSDSIQVLCWIAPANLQCEANGSRQDSMWQDPKISVFIRPSLTSCTPSNLTLLTCKCPCFLITDSCVLHTWQNKAYKQEHIYIHTLALHGNCVLNHKFRPGASTHVICRIPEPRLTGKSWMTTLLRLSGTKSVQQRQLGTANTVLAESDQAG